MIQLSSAGKRFGPKLLFDNLDWLITPNERVGLVGANGTGKSTLAESTGRPGVARLRQHHLCQEHHLWLPASGWLATLRPHRLRRMHVGVQQPAGAGAGDGGPHAQDRRTRSHARTNTPRWPIAIRRSSSEFRVKDGYALDSQVGTVLDGLGFRKEDWTRYTEEFSGGWQMRIALAKLLLSKPNLLLLDEPTNHLDLETRNWLEQYLLQYPFAYVLISHDRYFLDVTVESHRRNLEQAGAVLQRQLREISAAEDRSAATRWWPLTRTNATASSSWRRSSIAFASRPPRPSRCRAASRNWKRSSASRFLPTSGPSTSLFPSRSPAGGRWWSAQM